MLLNNRLYIVFTKKKDYKRPIPMCKHVLLRKVTLKNVSALGHTARKGTLTRREPFLGARAAAASRACAGPGPRAPEPFVAPSAVSDGDDSELGGWSTREVTSSTL